MQPRRRNAFEPQVSSQVADVRPNRKLAKEVLKNKKQTMATEIESDSANRSAQGPDQYRLNPS